MTSTPEPTASRPALGASRAEMVDLVMRHEWMPGHNFSSTTAHANHQYDASCAVCRGDVARILDVALGGTS